MLAFAAYLHELTRNFGLSFLRINQWNSLLKLDSVEFFVYLWRMIRRTGWKCKIEERYQYLGDYLMLDTAVFHAIL